MPNLREMRQKRTKLGTDAQAILDAAMEAGRSMTPEEETKFDALMDERDGFDKTIERAERLREEDAGRADEGEGEGEEGQGDEAGRAFRAYLLGGRANLTPAQARALNAGNDPEGGFLVAPEQFVEQLLKAVDDMVPLRGLATVQQLTTAESLGIPTLDTDLSDAEWTSEIGTGSQDDGMRFGKRELTPNPIAKRVKVSRKLLRVGRLGPEAIVRQRMAYKFGVTQEKAFMTGDGNKKPLGLFTASNDGIPTTRDVNIATDGSKFVHNSTNGYAADGFIDAKYTLKGQYHPRARWLLHRLILAEVRKIKDSDGQYIWRAGLETDRPDTILDVPYVLSEYAPSTLADNDYLAILGDLSFYWVAEALQFEVQRLVELYAESNQVGFIGRAEADGMPVMAEAFVRLQSNDVVA
ncbi:phage major capsid protein [Spirillospora sp. NBC_00431]